VVANHDGFRFLCRRACQPIVHAPAWEGIQPVLHRSHDGAELPRASVHHGVYAAINEVIGGNADCSSKTCPSTPHRVCARSTMRAMRDAAPGAQ
jgi:hypothetical protein